jgi:hypothetical protein
MIWLTWRQFRAQAIVAAAALAALAVLYGITGPHLAHLYDASGLPACGPHHDCVTLTSRFLDVIRSDATYPALYFLGAGIVYITPGLIGLFWGAPLVTRELETGTFRLAWNQSVTRTRWMAVKLAVIGLAAMLTSGLISLVVTWWADPIDRAGGFPVTLGQLGRFGPEMFGAHGIVPVGYAAFAFVVGVTAGVLVRRMVPAMAVTLAVFAAFQIMVPTWVRPHLITPVTQTTAVHLTLSDAVVSRGGQMIVPVTNLPGAWILSNQTITGSGQVFTLPVVRACQDGTQQQCDSWLAAQDLRRRLSYEPASRYWAFQWYETALYLALALAIAALGIWRVRKEI